MTPHTTVGVALAAGLVPALAGPPGVGKTAMLETWAMSANWRFAVLELSQCDPTDLAGLPIPTLSGTVVRAPLKLLADLADHEGDSLLLLDDLSGATPATQAAALRLLLNRQCGDLTLPPQVSLAVAYNPTDQGGLFALEPAVAGRLLHIEMEADPQLVASGFCGAWPQVPHLPAPPTETVDRWRAEIAAFFLRRPSLVLASTEGPAAPSPRTWEMAAVAAACAEHAGLGEGDIHAAVTASVGIGAASELIAWREERDLPDPAAMLADPATAPPVADTDRPDRTLLIADALVDTALRSQDPSWVAAAWTLLAAALDAGQGDVVLLAARRLTEARQPGQPIPTGAGPLLDLLAAA